MMNKRAYLLTGVLSFAAAFLLTGCSKGVNYDSAPSTNSGSQGATTSPSPASKANAPAAPRTPGGTPIDTSQMDSAIAQAESTYQQKPSDGEARKALANAYLARADALTKVQQYGSALGDYRRTLKYDPENKSALDMSATIISIFKSLGREAPAEGKEPPPKPMDGSASQTEGASPKSY